MIVHKVPLQGLIFLCWDVWMLIVSRSTVLFEPLIFVCMVQRQYLLVCCWILVDNQYMLRQS